MYTNINDDDKTCLINGTVAVSTKIIVKATDKLPELVLTEEDAIKSWEHNEERYVPDQGFIGKFIARTLSGELHNIDDEFNIENREIELQIGLVQLGTRFQYLFTEDNKQVLTENGIPIIISELESDVITWYSLGSFLISKPEDDEVSDNTTFEAFDLAVTFNKDFNADYTNNNFPVSFNDTLKDGNSFTALQLALYVCQQVGVELGNSDFINSSFIINSNQFTEGNSCRNVMESIAQLAYGWCRIGWDDKCYIDNISTNYNNISKFNSLTNDNYYSLTTQKEKYGPINKVVVGMSSIEGESVSSENIESIEENGEYEIAIYDNPITFTEELRNLALNGAEKLFGLEYIPFEMETPGHPWFKGNEPIAIYDMEGNVKYTYPFNVTISYTGHIKTLITAPGLTKQDKMMAYSRTLYKTLRDVKIQVNKQEGVINITNSKVQASIDGLSALETRFNNEITDTYSKQEIQEIISGTAADGTVVSSVKSTTGTFDMNGLTIEQSEKPKTKTNINADGMVIYNKESSLDDDQLLNVNSEGMTAKNVKVKVYLNVGKHSRIEDYTHTDYTEGTGVFWIGGSF